MIKYLYFSVVILFLGSCSSDSNDEIPLSLPTANFEASFVAIESGNSVTFTNTSKLATSYSWTFEGGSPDTSNEQNPTVTYNNYGVYPVTLTATNSAGNAIETKAAYITVSMQTASYDITFKTNWTSENHPTDFPANDHFSSAVGMTHKSDINLFTEEELASIGIKDMAERGNNEVLISEINTLITAGSADQLINGGGLPNGTMERTFTIEVSEEFSLISLVSMIAPSPDWFVALENYNLFTDGTFVSEVTIDGISYDSGTDSGTTFTSDNLVTSPLEIITRITTAPLGNGQTVDPPIAYFVITKN